ncbi:unnamed protein product [Didymodactylos carnosus]|uniref:Uncharacterized protein n=1 Tax=Didymodactylos carnosus TaxID=1234261 RepID=A0A813QP15_9BILA|nr:unnamed protein product [Didymodactylos carnosus]CAF3551834.1 unnamed protein product [Didymodactylos carnosus]
MQAYGRYDFNATAQDELSFSKGAILKVLNMEEDMNWYKAELRGTEGYVPKTYIEMVPNPWFHRGIGRDEAEKILLQKDTTKRFIHPDGAFLVRMCESLPGDFSLSVKYQDQVQHFKVLRDGMGKYFLWVVKFDSINELIDYHRTTSVNRGQTLLLKDMSSSGNHHEYPKQQQQTSFNQQQTVRPQPSPASQMYQAAYDFKPQEEGEIELKRGDRVRIIDETDESWWKGEVRGRIGLFPAACSLADTTSEPKIMSFSLSMASPSTPSTMTAIFRRASSFITSRSSSKAPPLDGEIVFSKNNVCVHPPSRLHSQTLHHPGYLCIKCQNNPTLGATLILTWIPNSTLKNRTKQQPITPNQSRSISLSQYDSQHSGSMSTSTPIRSNTLNLQDHQLSAISMTDSDYHSQQHSFASLFSPQPKIQISDNENGSDDHYEDACDGSDRRDSITSGATEGPDEQNDIDMPNDLDDNDDDVLIIDENEQQPPMLKETSWKNVAGIYEKQNTSLMGENPMSNGIEQPKTVAEQFCGVFSVDLGQMRSLRLFYCDELTNSGQLVIASCESQYKVLHFHQGGLDKLTQVFNEWNIFAVEKTKAGFTNCHQFNVIRPTIDLTDLHPEEGCYHLITADSIFFGGIDPSISRDVWPFLLHLYPFDSTYEQREIIRHQKFLQYQKIRAKRDSAVNESDQLQFVYDVEKIIEKDVVRTDRSNPYYKGDKNPNLQVMKDILMNYACYCPTMGYNQGMSDLLAPVLAIIQNESDAFWCFVGLMNRTIFISTPTDDVMEKQLKYLRELLHLMLPDFYYHCTKLSDGLDLLFSHRWILLCFKREFPELEALRMWESCWAHFQTDYFHLFICISIMAVYGDDIVQQHLGTDDTLLHFNSLAMHMNGAIVLKKARSLLYKFRLLPRIPCVLHDICLLCGPGMWDSIHVPQVYCICTTSQEKERCPFSGICL